MNLYKKESETSELQSITTLIPEVGTVADLVDYLIDMQNKYAKDELFYSIVKSKKDYEG
jgi:hypothetical protein